jgi:diaminopimelate decarboxylase
MDAVAFATRYPEFSTTDPDTVTAVLGEAARECATDIYGARVDDAVGALAAHKLFLSPAGLSLRTESDQADSSDYLKAYQQIRRECSPKFMVL